MLQCKFQVSWPFFSYVRTMHIWQVSDLLFFCWGPWGLTRLHDKEMLQLGRQRRFKNHKIWMSCYPYPPFFKINGRSLFFWDCHCLYFNKQVKDFTCGFLKYQIKILMFLTKTKLLRIKYFNFSFFNRSEYGRCAYLTIVKVQSLI